MIQRWLKIFYFWDFLLLSIIGESHTMCFDDFIPHHLPDLPSFDKLPRSASCYSSRPICAACISEWRAG